MRASQILNFLLHFNHFGLRMGWRETEQLCRHIRRFSILSWQTSAIFYVPPLWIIPLISDPHKSKHCLSENGSSSFRMWRNPGRGRQLHISSPVYKWQRIPEKPRWIWMHLLCRCSFRLCAHAIVRLHCSDEVRAEMLVHVPCFSYSSYTGAANCPFSSS